ncbi:MAG: hypothetical protein Q7S98_02810, partial [Deltaproteobacteria bacterium]|nr:hypothetical protein [Deltaproteobacteria bacterium]
EAGTDPDGSFALESIKIGNDTEIQSTSGKIEDVSVPPATPYVLKVSYSPKTTKAPYQAILTVATDSPSQALYQVQLDGVTTGEGASCSSSSGSEAAVAVDFDGERTLEITRLVSVTQKLQNDPLTSDPEVTARPFVPVDLKVTFDRAGGTFRFPKITDDDEFVLPPTLNPNVRGLIPGDTIITTDTEVSGTYTDAAGVLELKDLLIKMRESGGAFQADLKITLTTQALPIPSVFNQGATLSRAGLNVVNGQLVGRSLSADDTSNSGGSHTLVGFGTFSNVSGNNGSIVNSLPNSQIAVQIEGRILPKDAPKK